MGCERGDTGSLGLCHLSYCLNLNRRSLLVGMKDCEETFLIFALGFLLVGMALVLSGLLNDLQV